MTHQTMMGIANPRKEDGSLGDLECDFCGTKGVVLLGITLDPNGLKQICKKCLEDGIEVINETILNI